MHLIISWDHIFFPWNTVFYSFVYHGQVTGFPKIIIHQGLENNLSEVGVSTIYINAWQKIFFALSTSIK